MTSKINSPDLLLRQPSNSKMPFSVLVLQLVELAVGGVNGADDLHLGNGDLLLRYLVEAPGGFE
jgi:hypothetical protein